MRNPGLELVKTFNVIREVGASYHLWELRNLLSYY